MLVDATNLQTKEDLEHRMLYSRTLFGKSLGVFCLEACNRNYKLNHEIYSALSDTTTSQILLGVHIPIAQFYVEEKNASRS